MNLNKNNDDSGNDTSNRFLKPVVLVFSVTSIIFLTYKLVSYPDYHTLISEIKTLPLLNIKWLIITILLLPLNWLTESVKWKIIVSETEKISLSLSFKSVMSGFSTGFFTPNRLGDFAGRIYFLNDRNRKTGITLSIFNSLSQNIAIAICGIPAALIFFFSGYKENLITGSYFIFTGISMLILITFYLLIPYIGKKIKSGKIAGFLIGLSNLSTLKVFTVILISMLRFCIFSIQFYTILLFFGVSLSFEEALIAIPASYLFVTFTPSIGFTDPVIRSSYAVIFIGTFSANTPAIALSGTGIWIINYVISMILGNYFVLNKVKSTTRKAS